MQRAARPVPGNGAGADRRRAPRDSTSPTSSRASASTRTRPKTPCVMGYEVAGTWSRPSGPDVTGFETGDRVIAATRFEGFAERAVADAANVLPLPEGMSFEQGAALPVNYGTAYAALELIGGGARAGRPCSCTPPPAGSGSRRCRSLRAPRRRGDRHRLGVQARGDPRAGRRARDRLPQPGREAGGRSGSPAGRGSTSCSTRWASSARATRCCAPAGGSIDVRRLEHRRRRPAQHRQGDQGGRDDAALQRAQADEREQGRDRLQPAALVGRARLARGGHRARCVELLEQGVDRARSSRRRSRSTAPPTPTASSRSGRTSARSSWSPIAPPVVRSLPDDAACAHNRERASHARALGLPTLRLSKSRLLLLLPLRGE